MNISINLVYVLSQAQCELRDFGTDCGNTTIVVLAYGAVAAVLLYFSLCIIAALSSCLRF